MARRIDYLNDPDAPTANSIVPSVNVVVVDEHERMLLIQRTDNENWALPGGAIDLGESLRQAAVRETLEETGIRCEVTGLVGIYTNPEHRIHYTSDDEVRQEFSVVLTARPTAGVPTVGSESSEVRWVSPAERDAYPMHASMRARVEDYLASRPGAPPHLD